MLNVYTTFWCPHCIKTEKYLKDHHIPYTPIDMDTATPEVVKKISEVNDGEWVVPTLEFNGSWRKGKVFIESELHADLQKMGVI